VTTRRPRPGEVDGRDYCFVDRARFETMIAGGELLEWAEVFGNLYGTPAKPVAQAIGQGRTIILEIDVQGALQVHGKMPGATFVLIVPPSDDELLRRLTGRGTETPDALRRRFAKAREEIAVARASGAYKHCVINNDLETAIKEVVEIIRQENR